MSIETMTDQEKSSALARLCNPHLKAVRAWKRGGYNVYAYSFWDDATFVMHDRDVRSKEEAVRFAVGNLYDPANMALAWRVLNWAIENFSIPSHHFALRAMADDMAFFTLPPADAQRAWLDKILVLAIEAGMVAE